MNQEIKRTIFIATKVIFGLFILIYFNASLVSCNEDIRFCNESLQALKDDVKDWQEKCSRNTLERQYLPLSGYWHTTAYRQDIDTPCCNAEKKYIQNRRRMQRKLCFYKGNHPV